MRVPQKQADLKRQKNIYLVIKYPGKKAGRKINSTAGDRICFLGKVKFTIVDCKRVLNFGRVYSYLCKAVVFGQTYRSSRSEYD